MSKISNFDPLRWVIENQTNLDLDIFSYFSSLPFHG